MFCRFAKYFQNNAGTISEIRTQLLPSTHFKFIAIQLLDAIKIVCYSKLRSFTNFTAYKKRYILIGARSVSYRHLTAAACFRNQARSCGICGEQREIRRVISLYFGFSPSVSFDCCFVLIFHSSFTNRIQSYQLDSCSIR